MSVNLVDVLRASGLYRASATLRRWGEGSVAVSLLRRERVQLLVVGGALVASLVHVLGSNMNAAVKFLSFALLFVLTTLVTWSLTEPLAE